MIPHSRPFITDADIEAVCSPLRTLMIGQGELAARFESRLARWVAGSGGVAVGSGSAAVYLALRALGVKEGDEVLMPTYVCPSVAEAVCTAGAIPALCDVGAGWVMTPDNVAPRLSPRAAAIIVPHIYGIYADVDGFRKFGLPVIEDSAQAIGHEEQRRIRGDIAVFSFHPTKCLTTGEGGMAVAASADLVAQMRTLRDGSADAIGGRLFSPLSDLAAALGLSQLDQYNAWLARRFAISDRYRSCLEAIAPGAAFHHRPENSACFRFPIRCAGGFAKHAQSFAANGVLAKRGVDKLLHRIQGLPDSGFPVSCALFEETLSLPLYPALKEDEVEQVLRACAHVLAPR